MAHDLRTLLEEPLSRRSFLQVTGGAAAGNLLPSLPIANGAMQAAAQALAVALDGSTSLRAIIFGFDVQSRLPHYYGFGLQNRGKEIIGKIENLATKLGELFTTHPAAKDIINGFFNAYPLEQFKTDKLIGMADAILSSKNDHLFSASQKRAARDMKEKSAQMPEKQWNACRNMIIHAFHDPLRAGSEQHRKIFSTVIDPILAKQRRAREAYLENLGVSNKVPEDTPAPMREGDTISFALDPQSPVQMLADMLEDLPSRNTGLLGNPRQLLDYVQDKFPSLRAESRLNAEQKGKIQEKQKTDAEPKNTAQASTHNMDDDTLPYQIAEDPAWVVAIHREAQAVKKQR